jgi:hypothetical protein
MTRVAGFGLSICSSKPLARQVSQVYRVFAGDDSFH